MKEAKRKQLARKGWRVGDARDFIQNRAQNGVRANVTIDWAVRENVPAQLHVLVKRILRKYGYPPDKQERATQTVLEHAEVLSGSWRCIVRNIGCCRFVRIR